MQIGRLEKSLNMKFRFSEGVFTLKNYIERYGVGKYLATVGTRNGIKNNVPSLQLKDGCSIDIPKIVYDALEFSA